MDIRPLFLLLAIVFFSFASPRTLFADERPNPIEDTLDTGSDYPLLTNEIPGMVIVVTYHQIRARGYRSLFEILRDLPGFSTRGGFGESTVNVAMDGESSQNNEKFLLFIDGVLEQDLWQRSVWMAYQYPVFFIKNITVFYGPAATRFGANAMSGVILIDTIKAEDLGERYGDISVTKDIRNGMWSLDLMLGHSYNRRTSPRLAKSLFSWYLRGRFYFSDERNSEYDSFWTETNPSVRSYFAGATDQFRLDYSRAFATYTNQGGRFVRSTEAPSEQIEQAVSSYRQRLLEEFLTDRANSGLYGRPTYINRNQTFTGEAGLRLDNWFFRIFFWTMGTGPGLRYPSYTQQPNSLWWIRNLAVSVHHLKSELWSSGVGEKANVIYFNLNLIFRMHEIPGDSHEIAFASQRSIFPNRTCYDPTGQNVVPCTFTEYAWKPTYSHVLSMSFRAQPKLDFQLLQSRLKLSVGLDTGVDFLQGAPVTSDRPYPERYAPPADASGAGNQYQHTYLSGFVQGDVFFTDWLTASVGLRSDWEWVRGDLDVVPNCERAIAPCYRFSSPLVGRASLLAKIAKFQIRLSYGYAFLSPSNWQLYGSGFSQSLDARDLLPQDKHSVEANFFGNIADRLFFTLSVFHHWLNNVNSLVVIPFRQNEIRSANVGNQMTLGSRLHTVFKLFSWMDLIANVTVLFPRLEVVNLQQSALNPIWMRDVPLFQGNFIVDIRSSAYETSHAFGSLRLNLQSGRQNIGFNQQENGQLFLVEGATTDFYAILHLSAGYLWRPPDSWPFLRSVSVSATAENVINLAYYDLGFRSGREPNFNPLPRHPGINGYFNLSLGF